MATETTKIQPASPQEHSAAKSLSLTRLRKVYGETIAVDGVSFDVGHGEIVGLLGRYTAETLR